MLYSHWMDTYPIFYVIALHFEFVDNLQPHKMGFVCSFVMDITLELLFVLQENGSSEEHVLYVWDHFVSKAAAKNVFIMAHSYGGLSFVELVSVLVFRLSVLPPTNKKTHNTLLPEQSLTYMFMLKNLHVLTLTQAKFQVYHATLHTNTHTCMKTY